MVLASHHVIREILEDLESEDIKKFKATADKFCERYEKDEELKKAVGAQESLATEYILTRSDESLDALKKELQRIFSMRNIEASGGEDLWFSDRRP